MLKLGIVIVVCALCGWASAQSDDPDQLSAATDRAVRQLYQDVANTPLDSRVTVGEFLERTRGQDELLSTLQRAQQIGGPRWIDDQTCQVQLEISGARVARTLSQIAARKPHRSPIAPDVLELRLADWRTRTFSTTGSSTAAARVEQIVPAGDGDDGWNTVSDDARRQAIGAAKYDAAIKVFDAIAPIPLSDGKTIGDALEIESVADHLHRWLADRPVTNLEFRDNLEVEITLAVPADEVSTVLREALGTQKQIAALDDEQWTKVAEQIRAAVPPAVGRGSVERDAVQTTRETPQIVGDDAPAWIDRRLTADGTAPRDQSKLRSARAAEADALKKLEAQIHALPLNAETTIARAAKQNGRIEDAVQRALRSARIVSTDYARPDGSVGVKVELELRNVWEELLRGP